MTPRRRGLVLLAGVVVAAGAGVALATDGSEAPEAAAVPEGGSGFRAVAGAPDRAAAEPARGPRAPAPRPPGPGALPAPPERGAARLVAVGFAGTTPGGPLFAQLRRREWGAVVVDDANVTGAAQLQALTGAVGASARSAGHVAPVLIAGQLDGAADALGLTAVRQQHAVTSPATARAQAASSGRALRHLGVSAVLAPSADLAVSGGPWERRAFPCEPDAASRLVAGAVTGWRSAGIAPVVGHFPGEGGASGDPEQVIATVGEDRAQLAAHDEAPFAAVARAAPAVQLSGALYASYDAVTPATLDPAVVHELRAQGFAGAVVSADLSAAAQAAGEGIGATAVTALLAGCDLLSVPGGQAEQEQAYQAVVRAIRAGRIPAARVRDALRHARLLRGG